MNMDLEQNAIMRLREAADTSERFYKAPLIVTTSGGKDSSVCVALAEKAGIDFEVMHNHTTVDAPETVYFIRREFKRLEEKGVKCTVNYPRYKGERVTMWSLIPQKLMPPTRLVRYCCSILKERGGQGRYITTGVRWAESAARKKNRGIFENGHSNPEKRVILNNDNDDRRRLFETCMRQHKAVCNPKLALKHGKNEVEGGVRVAHNQKQHGLFIPDGVQLHFIVLHQFTHFPDVKRGYPHTFGNHGQISG